MKEEHKGVIVAGRNITYTISGKKGVQKKVLDNVNFIAYPGHLTVIMGPSGSGKTTLLNASAGRIRDKSMRTKLTGDLLFDGRAREDCPDLVCNYVMQTDAFHEFLTVRETLYFGGRIRLKGLSHNARQERIDQVVSELGLNNCLDVKIGGTSLKGISGGQKKRLSIAMETLNNPNLLFLDEPTSGLDSALAYDTIHVINKLAQSGMTIIATIHQPRSQVFALFDRLLLLCEGQTVYLGDVHEAENYFASIGHKCPPHFNPSDFFLDLLSSNEAKEQTPFVSELPITLLPLEQLEKPELTNEQPTSSETSDAPFKTNSIVIQGRAIITQTARNELPIIFQQSQFNQNLQKEIDAQFERTIPPVDKSSQRPNCGQTCSDSCVNYSTLSRRSFLNNSRNPTRTIVQVAVHILYAFLLGGIFYQLPRGDIRDGQAIFGLFFFLISQYAFANLDTLFSIPSERVIFNRDAAQSLYSPFNFFMAKMSADIVFQHGALIIFSMITYLLVGLGGTLEQFAMFVFIGIVCTFTANSYIYMIGTSVPGVETATIIAPIGEIIFLLLTGFFIKDDQIPKWIAWLRHVNYLRYAFFAFSQNEFRLGQRFGPEENNLFNDELLVISGIPLHPGMWINTLICFCIGIVFRIVALIFVKYLNRGVGIEA